jgi:hypothetical protein
VNNGAGIGNYVIADCKTGTTNPHNVKSKVKEEKIPTKWSEYYLDNMQLTNRVVHSEDTREWIVTAPGKPALIKRNEPENL